MLPRLLQPDAMRTAADHRFRAHVWRAYFAVLGAVWLGAGAYLIWG